MSTTLTAAQPETTAPKKDIAQPETTAPAATKKISGRPALANTIWEEFQSHVDDMAKKFPDHAKLISKEFWLGDVYKNFVLMRVKDDKQMNRYLHENMQSAIWNILLPYLSNSTPNTLPTTHTLDFSNIGANNCKYIYGNQHVAINCTTTHIKVLNAKQEVTFEKVFHFNLLTITWEWLKERYFKSDYATYCWLWRVKEEIGKQNKSVRSTTENAARHQRAGGGSNPPGRSAFIRKTAIREVRKQEKEISLEKFNEFSENICLMLLPVARHKTLYGWK